MVENNEKVVFVVVVMLSVHIPHKQHKLKLERIRNNCLVYTCRVTNKLTSLSQIWF